MREVITEAAAALGYQPNVIARSLSTGSSKLVAVLLGTAYNPFYGEVLEQLGEALRSAGYQLLLLGVRREEDVERQIRFLTQYNVDAVIVASSQVSQDVARDWARTGRKAVLFNRTTPDSPSSSVTCNNYQGGRAVAEHFFEIGRRKLAFAAGFRGTSTNAAERAQGFLEGVLELGAKLSGKVEGGEFTFQTGYAAALDLAKLNPDAIFFGNDVMAIGGLEALRKEIGIRVPEDVAVAGFDDIAMAAWPSYSLTTIRQPVASMVEATMRLINSQTTNEPQHLQFVGELVRRSSTQSPKPLQSRSAPGKSSGNVVSEGLASG